MRMNKQVTYIKFVQRLLPQRQKSTWNRLIHPWAGTGSLMPDIQLLSKNWALHVTLNSRVTWTLSLREWHLSKTQMKNRAPRVVSNLEKGKQKVREKTPWFYKFALSRPRMDWANLSCFTRTFFKLATVCINNKFTLINPALWHSSLLFILGAGTFSLFLLISDCNLT